MKNIGYSFNGFTTSRLKRFLTTGGQEYKFVEWTLNEYNEPTNQISSEKSVLGVLHRTSSAMYSSEPSVSAGSKTRSNQSTSIITSWESLVTGFSGGKELLPGMTIELDEFKYKIVRIENLNSWGIVANICLEEYDGWEH